MDLVGIATTDPSPRLILSTFAVSKLRSASPRLHGETQYAISDGEGARPTLSVAAAISGGGGVVDTKVGLFRIIPLHLLYLEHHFHAYYHIHSS